MKPFISAFFSRKTSIDTLKLHPDVANVSVGRPNELVIKFVNGDRWYIFGNVEEAAKDALNQLEYATVED